MKNKTLLCCILFTYTTLHCSEQQKQLDLIKQIDYKKIEQTLHDNYITYACKQLEEYQTTDYTPENMSNIVKMHQCMVGFYNFPYNQIRDKNGNNFIRIAVKKMDLPIVDWHVTKQGAHCITQEDFDYCIELCINQLHPEKTKKNVSEENTAYNIFKILTIKSGEHVSILWEKSYREHLIKQLILLQIKHKKHQSNFPINEELITQHITSDNNDQSPIVLKDLYQSVANKKGNTLSHITVELQNADELYQLINKNYISSVPNKSGKTIVDLALHHFQMFIQDIPLFDMFPKKGTLARCCLFMLLKYIKSIQNGSLCNEYTCCDKHVIII